MSPLLLVVLACGLFAVSGVPGMVLSRRSSGGQLTATVLAGLGAVFGLCGVSAALLSGAASTWQPGGAAGETVGGAMGWPLPGGALHVGLDALSAFFLAPTFLVGGLGAVFGRTYWSQERHPRTGARVGLFWGLLVAALIVVFLARNTILFLAGWEVMALTAFALVMTESHLDEVRKAGWLYLLATHAGTLCLFAMFALLRAATGSFALRPLVTGEAGIGVTSVIFVLGLIGFGLKAGIVPLHVWLPPAHAAAPSHVSALMSGVVIKAGVYGLVRLTSLLPDSPASWGALLLVLGAVSGVLGVAFALGQHDLKRLLAYHSVENIGIIVMGLGLALVGRAVGRADLLVLGLAGCLLHVWNHALFKSLLFLGAGSVVRAAGTRGIDRLGGLSRRMPWTAALFGVGAVAICGLPPLNGFVSELLVFLGLFRSLGPGHGAAWPAVALAAPILALIGALAVACFVKVCGAAFLGEPRSERARSARESPAGMLLPMGVLAGLCVAIGLAPAAVAPMLDRAVAAWAPGAAPAPLASLAPLGIVGGIAVALVAVTLAVAVVAGRRRPAVAGVPTWDCGYARPSARMQYTASSFAQPLVTLFRWVLRPSSHVVPVAGPFPGPSALQSHVGDTFLERLILPAYHALERRLRWFRVLQQGSVQQYLFYIAATVLVMAACLLPFRAIAGSLLGR